MPGNEFSGLEAAAFHTAPEIFGRQGWRAGNRTKFYWPDCYWLDWAIDGP